MVEKAFNVKALSLLRVTGKFTLSQCCSGSGRGPAPVTIKS
jgi:hypothetical protein